MHILFSLAVLLLKKTLPIVFVPHAFRLAPIAAGHVQLNASFALRAKFFHAPPLFANRSSTWRSCIRLCPWYVRLRETTCCHLRSDLFARWVRPFRLCFI